MNLQTPNDLPKQDLELKEDLLSYEQTFSRLLTVQPTTPYRSYYRWTRCNVVSDQATSCRCVDNDFETVRNPWDSIYCRQTFFHFKVDFGSKRKLLERDSASRHIVVRVNLVSLDI